MLILWNVIGRRDRRRRLAHAHDQERLVRLPDRRRDPAGARDPDPDQPSRPERDRSAWFALGVDPLADRRPRLPDASPVQLQRGLGERRLAGRRGADGARLPHPPHARRSSTTTSPRRPSPSSASPSSRLVVPPVAGADRRADRPRRAAHPAGHRHHDPAGAGVHPHRPPAALGARGEARARRDPRRGAGGLPREVGVPRHDEPRDPHAHERRHRPDRPAAEHRARRPPAPVRRGRARRRRRAADDHQRHPRLLEGRGRQARARDHRLQPARRSSRTPPSWSRSRRSARASSCWPTARRSCPLALRGDPSRCARCCSTSPSNAVKFTDEGEVVLRAQLEEPAGGRRGGAVRGRRHRCRHRRRGHRAPLRRLLAGRLLDHPQVRRHRPRSRHLAPARDRHGRHARRRQRAGRGQHLLVHAAAPARLRRRHRPDPVDRPTHRRAGPGRRRQPDQPADPARAARLRGAWTSTWSTAAWSPSTRFGPLPAPARRTPWCCSTCCMPRHGRHRGGPPDHRRPCALGAPA